MINWTYKTFDKLNPEELYEILRLRSEVFVVEQNCVFLDMDNKDQQCYHVMGWEDGILCAYTRLVPAGISYEEPSIGRVVTAPSARKKGFGKKLMHESISILFQLWGKSAIKIGAQLYLKDFYESIGFQQTSDEYLEDNIPHIEMIRY